MLNKKFFDRFQVALANQNRELRNQEPLIYCSKNRIFKFRASEWELTTLPATRRNFTVLKDSYGNLYYFRKLGFSKYKVIFSKAYYIRRSLKVPVGYPVKFSEQYRSIHLYYSSVHDLTKIISRFAFRKNYYLFDNPISPILKQICDEYNIVTRNNTLAHLKYEVFKLRDGREVYKIMIYPSN